MTRAQKRQIRNETIVGACINALLSLLAGYLVFGGRTGISFCCDSSSLAFDAIPHGFAVSFMATLIPSLFVLHRVRKGRVQGCLPVDAWLTTIRGRILARAAIAGGVGGLVGFLGHLAASWIAPAFWPLHSVLIFKPLYGMAVSIIATPAALYLLFAHLSSLAPGPRPDAR